MGGETQAQLDTDFARQLEGARVFDLEQPRRMHMPTYPAHWPGLVFAMHRHHEPSSEPRTSASGLITMAEHSGTHIDALCHQAENLRLHGGTDITPEVQTSAGFRLHGVETLEPIIKRACLIDLVSWRGASPAPGESVEAQELREAASNQGLSIASGKVVLVRTGFGAAWDDTNRYLAACGIASSGSQWLADQGVYAVGIDNVVWDVPEVTDPATGSTLPGHVILLVRSGIYIIENLYLEELAESGIGEFVLVCLPLKFQGGTGSPVRPIALVPSAG